MEKIVSSMEHRAATQLLLMSYIIKLDEFPTLVEFFSY